MSNLPKIKIGTIKAGDSECSVSMGAFVRIDGNEIKGIQSVDVHLSNQEFATVNIQLCGEVDIDKIRGIPNIKIIDDNKEKDYLSYFHDNVGWMQKIVKSNFGLSDKEIDNLSVMEFMDYFGKSLELEVHEICKINDALRNVKIVDQVELCKGEILDEKIVACTGLTDRQWSAERLSGLEQ